MRCLETPVLDPTRAVKGFVGVESEPVVEAWAVVLVVQATRPKCRIGQPGPPRDV